MADGPPRPEPLDEVGDAGNVRACRGRRYTAARMKSTVEPLEGNKVKVSVEVDADEFEKDIDAAFRKLAREVRVDGFRPGKAPRRVLEARLGKEVGRQQALQDALPTYYVKAVDEHEVDVIAPPDIEITGGEDDGAVQFDAVVEVRPVIIVPGYKSIEITIDSYLPTDEEIDQQLESMRGRFATFEAVERPAEDGDNVLIDIVGTIDDEEVPGLTADDYSFTVGGPFPVPEVHEQLTGASVGDVLEFDADHPAEDNDSTIHFRIEVKEVKAKVLPDLDDAFAAEASEFDSLAALRDDLIDRASTMKKYRARMAVGQKTQEALAALVEEDAPAPLVEQETSQRIQNWVMQLQAQGIDLGTYFQITGESQEEVVDQMRAQAVQAVKVDLALRSIADAEGIETTDEDLDAEIEDAARRTEQKPEKLRRQLERNGQLQAVRSDLRVRKAFDWLCENVQIVDTDGNRIDVNALAVGDDEDDDEGFGLDEAGAVDLDGSDAPEDTDSRSESE